MKKILMLVALMVAPLTAHAADLYEPVPPPYEAPPPAPYFDWAGSYLGLQGGYDINNFWADATPGTIFTYRGGIAGIYAGHNWQSDRLVFGIDLSANYSFFRGVTLGNPVRMGFKGFARGRIGVGFDRILLYATGGLAVESHTVTVGGVTQTSTRPGWTVGGGLEAALSDRWTARVDYAFSRFSGFAWPALFPPGTTASANSHTIMLGVAYKFGQSARGY